MNFPDVPHESDFVFDINEIEEEELEFFAEAGVTFSPSDYYFKMWIAPEPDYILPFCATITPKKFFDANGYHYDGHVTQEAGGLLALHPEYGEEAEGSVSPFDQNMTAAEMEADLIKRGFIHNPGLLG